MRQKFIVHCYFSLLIFQGVVSRCLMLVCLNQARHLKNCSFNIFFKLFNSKCLRNFQPPTDLSLPLTNIFTLMPCQKSRVERMKSIKLIMACCGVHKSLQRKILAHFKRPNHHLFTSMFDLWCLWQLFAFICSKVIVPELLWFVYMQLFANLSHAVVFFLGTSFFFVTPTEEN